MLIFTVAENLACVTADTTAQHPPKKVGLADTPQSDRAAGWIGPRALCTVLYAWDASRRKLVYRRATPNSGLDGAYLPDTHLDASAGKL